MQILFIKTLTDPGVRVYHAGSSADFSEVRALALIHHGIATPVIDKPAGRTETAAVPRKRNRENRS